MAEPDVVTPDVTQLKAITHPLRLTLLGRLRLYGPSTATRLADVVGESSGSTSYHLRQLQRHGFVEEAPEIGSGRERWWRATARFTRTGEAPQDDAAKDAAGAFHQAVVTTYAARAQQAVAEEASLPAEWAGASAASDAVVRVTAQQAAEIRRRLEALVWQVVEDYPAPTDAVPGDTRLYDVQIQAFVAPGQDDG